MINIPFASPREARAAGRGKESTMGCREQRPIKRVERNVRKGTDGDETLSLQPPIVIAKHRNKLTAASPQQQLAVEARQLSLNLLPFAVTRSLQVPSEKAHRINCIFLNHFACVYRPRLAASRKPTKASGRS